MKDILLKFELLIRNYMPTQDSDSFYIEIIVTNEY